MPRRTALDRFLAKVREEDRGHSTPCWTWTAHVHGPTGYGRFYLEGRVVEAHAAAYRLFVGAIPRAVDLDHLCRNRDCANPAHLDPVPHRVNTARGESNSARTVREGTCHRGHEMTPDNVYTHQKTGHRRCRKCQKERDAAFNERRRARRRALASSRPGGA